MRCNIGGGVGWCVCVGGGGGGGGGGVVHVYNIIIPFPLSTAALSSSTGVLRRRKFTKSYYVRI